MVNEVLVSIIIPTYNSRFKLQKALESIENIEFDKDDFEVVVVDDGSTDDTWTYLCEIINNIGINLCILRQENRGPSAARNNAIRVSKGKYLLSIDSDCTVEKQIINRYLAYFPDEKLAGVGGNVIPDTLGFVSSYLDHLDVWRPWRRNDEIQYLVTANAFFVKEIVVKAGCFDESFRIPGGEEPELCHRIRSLGYNFAYEKEAIVHHAHRSKVDDMYRMFKNHGTGYALYISKWPAATVYRPTLSLNAIGRELFRRFLSYYHRHIKTRTAMQFLFLDLIRIAGYRNGYRSMIKKLVGEVDGSC